jgi:ribosomal protein S18 acetylase RimI-like enzyme
MSEEQLEAVERLEAACAGDGRLKLEWPTLRTRPTEGPARDFLFAGESNRDGDDDGEIVGFLGLYNFGPGLTEICGMVRPDRRRQGIFTALLTAAEGSVMKYEKPAPDGRLERLLVVDRRSESGQGFAAARRGTIEHSEYEMVRVESTIDLEQFRRYDELGVRPARESDRRVLSTVLASAFSTGEDVATDLADRLVSIEGTTAVVWRGAPVGMLRAAVTGSGDEASAEVSGFAIAEEYRGRGFGHQVLAEVLETLDRSGVSKVSLDAATNNARALGLYLDLGFEQVGAMDYYAYPFTVGSTTNITRQ